MAYLKLQSKFDLESSKGKKIEILRALEISLNPKVGDELVSHFDEAGTKNEIRQDNAALSAESDECKEDEENDEYTYSYTYDYTYDYKYTYKYKYTYHYEDAWKRRNF